tara:strand:- start:2352 stop:3452 length:1101 start_codon:yes stop_codon:yes gene_type:complete
VANQDIKNIRFYCDYVSYLLSRGVAQNTNFDVTATGGSGATATRGLQNGTEAELFDMRPLNLCDFDTSGDTDSKVLITLNLQSGSPKQTFIAILNHNSALSGMKFRVFAGDASSDVATVNGGAADTADVNWGNETITEIVNGDAIDTASDNKSFVVQPATDGSTIITFTEQSLQYWGIQFEGNSGGSILDVDETWSGSVDFAVANILIGEHYSMPVSPDLQLSRTIAFDKVNIQESLGGQRYSNTTSFGRQSSTTTRSPFTTNDDNYKNYGGRQIFDFAFSYLNSTDLMPDEYSRTDLDDDAVVEDVWNRVNGGALPMIMSVDDSSVGAGSESEHIFGRFNMPNGLVMNQVMNKIWSIKMKVEEEF